MRKRRGILERHRGRDRLERPFRDAYDLAEPTETERIEVAEDPVPGPEPGDVPPDGVHDVGRLPDPLSNDPLGTMLVTVAGSSRYRNPDTSPDPAYSTPFC